MSKFLDLAQNKKGILHFLREYYSTNVFSNTLKQISSTFEEVHHDKTNYRYH